MTEQTTGNEPDANAQREEDVNEKRVIDFGEYRVRGLNPRQREVLRRIEHGARCGLCGDLGTINESGKPVPCLGCGRRADA